MDHIPENKKNRGSAADTKAFEGREWLTVYTTKEENAGKPVLADIVVTDKPEAPSGHDGKLHIIG